MERNNVNVTGLMKDHLYTTSMRWESFSWIALKVPCGFYSLLPAFSRMSQVNLVSEHIWCKDFLVRSFYLKNVQTQETRTLTQFHLLSWPAQGIPSSTRPLLDFRRYNTTPILTGHTRTHTHSDTQTDTHTHTHTFLYDPRSEVRVN